MEKELAWEWLQDQWIPEAKLRAIVMKNVNAMVWGCFGCGEWLEAR